VDQKERETNKKVRILWLIIYLTSEHIPYRIFPKEAYWNQL
jgi:hypothetical protein